MKNLSMKEIKKTLTSEEFKEFNKWMVNQIVPVLDNGETEVYKYDFKRWLKWKCHGVPEPV